MVFEAASSNKSRPVAIAALSRLAHIIASVLCDHHAIHSHIDPRDVTRRNQQWLNQRMSLCLFMWHETVQC